MAGLFVFTLVAAAFSRLANELSNSLSLTGGGLENLVFAIAMPVVYLIIGPVILQFIGGHLGGYFFPSIRYMLRYGFGVFPMVFPSKMAEQATPMAMAAATGGAGVAVAGAAMGPGSPGYGSGATTLGYIGYWIPSPSRRSNGSKEPCCNTTHETEDDAYTSGSSQALDKRRKTPRTPQAP